MTGNEPFDMEAHGLPPAANEAPTDGAVDTPLEPWLASLAADALRVDAHDVPRELMWARIRQQRRQDGGRSTREFAVETAPAGVAVAGVGRRPLARSLTRVLAIAATLAVGVAIGRYGMPGVRSAAELGPASIRDVAQGTPPVAPLTNAQAQRATAPEVVAMEEHLARTVALLTTVRNDSPDARPGADVVGWARELLNTTRLLIDEPQLKDDRTRRLLQDLELVLVQIIQARGTTAPEARRAPSETMRETNLLPRVRAVVTASMTAEESSFRGIAE